MQQVSVIRIARKYLPLIISSYMAFTFIMLSISNPYFAIEMFTPRAREIDIGSVILINMLLIVILSGVLYVTATSFQSNFLNLRSESSPRYDVYDLERQSALVAEQVKRLISKEIQVPRLDLSNEEKAELISRIARENKIDLNNIFVDKLKRSAQVDEILKIKDRMLNRMGIQVETLGSRANFTLMWGMLFAAFGIGMIYYSFYLIEPLQVPGSYIDIIKQYMPKFALIFVVELIAFFFLRLYAKAIDELRYVQNEITNVEARLIGVLIAISNGGAMLSGAVSALVSTERNFVLEKGQSTIELEKDRAEMRGFNASIEAAAKIIHGSPVKPKTRKPAAGITG